jgi:hypothetical protein
MRNRLSVIGVARLFVVLVFVTGALVVGCGSKKSGGGKGGGANSASGAGGQMASGVDPSQGTADLTISPACTASIDGEAFCLDDTNLIFCSGADATWYDVDCSQLLSGGYCYDDGSGNISCSNQ